MNKELIDSIFNKNTEIHYNEWQIKIDNKLVKLELKGKIKCPVLNCGISSLVCSKLMDREDWPRGIDKQVCQKCSCFINLSISKFKANKKDPSNEKKS
jgi:hypothetical protein